MHSARRVWQCRRCGAQSSVTAGTVMHGTRMPLQRWFWAAYLVATHHPGISAVQLQCQLGIRRHETAWMMLHKLRAAMVAPQREPLKREVEVDEFFLGGFEEGLKGGRARGKKTLCGVAVEVHGKGSGRVRLQLPPRARRREPTTRPLRRGVAVPYLRDRRGRAQARFASRRAAARRRMRPGSRPLARDRDRARCPQASRGPRGAHRRARPSARRVRVRRRSPRPRRPRVTALPGPSRCVVSVCPARGRGVRSGCTVRAGAR